MGSDGLDNAANDRRVVVGVDVGGTKTGLLATDVVTGRDLGGDEFATDADAGAESGVDAIEQAVRGLVRRVDRTEDDLAAVGIAVPGLVDVGAGRVIDAGNLAGWKDLPLRDLLARRLGVPVFLEQDANAAALGEKWRGAARNSNNVVFLALGTGIGAGLVVNGRLHRGFRNAAGEVGNLVLGREFLGQRTEDGVGNLARLIGGRTLRRRAEVAAGERLSPAEAIDRANEDDRLEPLADDAVAYVAMTIVALGALLDPEAVILGGGTAQAGEHLIEPVREIVARELPCPPAIMQSVLGTEAQLHGAVFGALWELDPDLALREELR
jgi:glucokinase